VRPSTHNDSHPRDAGRPAAQAAGVIAQAAWVSLRAAIHCLRTRPLPLTQTAAVTTMAAIITAAHRAYAPIRVRSGSAMVTWRW
jgi:hypothetical protein